MNLTVVVSDYWERQTFIFVEYSFGYIKSIHLFTYSSPDSFDTLQLGKEVNNVTEFVNLFLQIQMEENKQQVENKFDKTTSTQGPLTTGAFNHHMFHNGANFILWWRPCAFRWKGQNKLVSGPWDGSDEMKSVVASV